MAKARKRKRGRPVKFNQEVAETIIKHLRLGGFLNHAAAMARVSYDAVRDWIDRGNAGDPRFAQFASDVGHAQGEHAARLQSVITRAAMTSDWRAAAWGLERRFPKEYGSAALHAAAVTVRSGAAIGGNDDGNETKVVFVLPPNGRRPGEDEDGR